MYGGYNTAKKSEESSDPRVPNSASKIQNNRNLPFRGLSSLSQVHTQPVRTKHLLDELREEYDDIDNSASKKPVQQPEGVDPLISWDKHSLPKGLEWMNPTPSKVKIVSSYTIPETVGKAAVLSTNENGNLPSAGHLDIPNALSLQVTKSNNVAEVISSSRAEPVNEINKENLFTPFKAYKMHDDFHVPIEMGLFSSSKKRLLSEIKSESKVDGVSHAPGNIIPENDFLFTPQKKSVIESAPALTDMHVPAPKKILCTPSIADHIPLVSQTSYPRGLQLPSSQTELKKSPIPLMSEPFAPLLTPAKPLNQIPATATTTNTPFGKLCTSTSKASLLEPIAHKNQSSVDDIINLWRTPAKANTQLNLRHELKSDSSIGHSHIEEKKKPTEENIVRHKENNNAIDIMPMKQTLPRKLDEVVLLEERPLPSKIPSILKSAQEAPLIACPVTSQSANPPETRLPLPVSKSSSEMLPPTKEVRKHPMKDVKAVQNNAASHSPDFDSVGKRSTNDQISVNGKPYTVLSLLGKGGSSVVYLVLEPVSSKLLAVKCVDLSGLDQSTYEGYLNEISLLFQLQDSDCVIRMLDHQHCKEEKILYVVMEKGETDLSNLIKDVSRTKTVSPAMAVYYWIEMLNAVSFIHKRGTIHSDLKPANFLLVSGRLKLIDFGIASSIQCDMTSVVKDSMTGTYNYISPEALCSIGSGPDGKSMRFKISYKSDVWSLGCILYNLVYGHTPFQAIAHPFMKMTAIANPNHKIPFPPAPGFPKTLLQAMQACLVRNPKLRPSVDELLQYQYLGSVNPTITDPSQALVEQIRTVVHSSDSPDNKLSSIQTLLSEKMQ